jgi:hypothetical protein
MPIDPTRITPNANILNVALSPTNGSLVAQIGDVQNEDVESYQAQWVQQSGFASIPPNAVPNQTASEGVILHTEYRDYVIGCRDFTTQNNYGNLGSGEACMYGAGASGTAQGKVICKGNSAVTIQTTDSGDASGNSVYLQISPTALSFVAPWGTLIFDKNGFQINTISGAGFNLGGLAAAGPLATLIGSFCNITAAMTSISSPFINIGDGTNITSISSALPLSLITSALTVSSPLVTLGDPTTPMTILSPLALSVVSSAALNLTGSTVNIVGVTTITGFTQVSGAMNVTGAVILEGVCEIVGALSSPLVPAPGIVSAFIFPA